MNTNTQRNAPKAEKKANTMDNKKHKPLYLNWQGPQGKETVDQFTRGEDAPEDAREFRRYVRAMQSEYAMAGMDTYQSSRHCKGWKE